MRIEDDAFIGPGSIILPHVTIGRGAVDARRQRRHEVGAAADDGAGQPRRAGGALRRPARALDAAARVLPRTHAGQTALKERGGEARIGW